MNTLRSLSDTYDAKNFFSFVRKLQPWCIQEGSKSLLNRNGHYISSLNINSHRDAHIFVLQIKKKTAKTF